MRTIFFITAIIFSLTLSAQVKEDSKGVYSESITGDTIVRMKFMNMINGTMLMQVIVSGKVVKQRTYPLPVFEGEIDRDRQLREMMEYACESDKLNIETK